MERYLIFIFLEGSQFGCVEKKTKSKNSNKIKSIGTDESITLMHGLGRVLNPKCKII